MNEEERLRHDWLKEFYGFQDRHGEDSQTLKEAENTAYNVLRLFIGDNLKDIFKRDSRDDLIRRRAIQQEKTKKSKTLNAIK